MSADLTAELRKLQDRIDRQADRILDLEAEVAITRRCNEHVECLCRGEVMDHAAAVARGGERKVMP